MGRYDNSRCGDGLKQQLQAERALKVVGGLRVGHPLPADHTHTHTKGQICSMGRNTSSLEQATHSWRAETGPVSPSLSCDSWWRERAPQALTAMDGRHVCTRGSVFDDAKHTERG